MAEEGKYFSLTEVRKPALWIGAFGLLAATGIYGTMAYAVSRRTREIGIRTAIGAAQTNVLGIVARCALILIACGTVLGLGTAILAGQLLGKILYGVEPSSPIAYATVFIASGDCRGGLLGTGATGYPLRSATSAEAGVGATPASAQEN